MARSLMATDWSAVQLKVVWGAPLAQLQEVLAEARPAAIFSFGQGGASGFALETRASNRRGAMFDNNQQLPAEPLIVADGPEQFSASTNCQALVEKLAEAGYPVRVSSNAGRYLCEECLYSLEYLKQKNKLAGQVMFCHVPPLGARVAGRVVDVEYVQQFVLDLLAGWLALYQASPPAQRAQQPEDAKTAEVRQFVDGYFRSWSSRQMDAYADCFHRRRRDSVHRLQRPRPQSGQRTLLRRAAQRAKHVARRRGSHVDGDSLRGEDRPRGRGLESLRRVAAWRRATTTSRSSSSAASGGS